MTIDRLCIGLVTSSAAIGLDPDHEQIVGALTRFGAEPVLVIWDDPEVNWDELTATVIRSTWDYHRRHSEFLAWADHVDRVTELHNPAPVVHWNTDKRYLADLAGAGVPVVPTTYLEPGGPVDRRLFDGELVVKPAVSAGSRDTSRYSPDDRDAAVAHAERLLDDGRAVLVQPYQEAVDREGETALVYIDGVLSHGFRKGPILIEAGASDPDALFQEEQLSARQPSASEAAIGDQVLDVITTRFGIPLYARVDLLPTPAGPLVLEVELVEPSLNHEFGPGSADRFAAAIVARAGHR